MDLLDLFMMQRRLKGSRQRWWANERRNPGTVDPYVSPQWDERFREAQKDKLNARMFQQMSPYGQINGEMPERRFNLENMPQYQGITGRRG